MYGKMQEFIMLTEITPLMYTLAVWGQCPVLLLFTFMHWRRKWEPTPVFLPGEFQGQGAWLAAVYGVAQSRT